MYLSLTLPSSSRYSKNQVSSKINKKSTKQFTYQKKSKLTHNVVNKVVHQELDVPKPVISLGILLHVTTGLTGWVVITPLLVRTLSVRIQTAISSCVAVAATGGSRPLAEPTRRSLVPLGGVTRLEPRIVGKVGILRATIIRRPLKTQPTSSTSRTLVGRNSRSAPSLTYLVVSGHAS